jgi:metal-responsive CopG/Arc/MetJ family transcriptional regulator
MRTRKKEGKIERTTITLPEDLLKKLDDFLDDEGLKEIKVKRSDFIHDVLNYIFDDFKKKEKKSILEFLYPEVKNGMGRN